MFRQSAVSQNLMKKEHTQIKFSKGSQNALQKKKHVLPISD